VIMVMVTMGVTGFVVARMRKHTVKPFNQAETLEQKATGCPT
jgi:hypothetical protein